MKLVSAANHLEELLLLEKNGVTEVLLELKDLSRFGVLTLAELHLLAETANKRGLKTVLVWDILMTNDRLVHAKEVLNKIDLSLFSAIRVQDSGALATLKSRYPTLPIQLVLETGNHNLEGVKRWCEAAGNTLERVILSNELTATTLAHYIQELSVPAEVLGLGPILLFYTPRPLLSFQKKDVQWITDKDETQKHRLSAIANAEEGFHKGFRLLENQHGTFMFHAKDYCLVDRLDRLVEMKLDTLRIDLRMNPTWAALARLSALMKDANMGQFNLETADAFIQNYPQKVTRCFFQANATDVLFKKLSNENIIRNDEGFIGEVVEVSKDRYLLIHVQSRKCKLKPGETYAFNTPEGKIKSIAINRITDLDRVEMPEATQNDFVLISYHKSIPTQTMIYANTTAK